MGTLIENSLDNIENSMVKRAREDYDAVGFTIPNLIKKKRDGIPLTRSEIDFFVRKVVQRHCQEMQLGISQLILFSAMYVLIVVYGVCFPPVRFFRFHVVL